jgi:hypothetical protein
MTYNHIIPNSTIDLIIKIAVLVLALWLWFVVTATPVV